MMFSRPYNYRLALNLSLLRNIRQFFLRLPFGNCPGTGNVLTGMVAIPGLCRVAGGRTKNTKVLVGKLELWTYGFSIGAFSPLRREAYRLPDHRWLGR
jgi:hypothetical protein